MRAKLVVSPHLDDAVLSCWHLIDGPGDVRVVNVFTALPGSGTPPAPWDRITGAGDSRRRMEERLDEDRRALALAGREAVGLDFLDSQYRDGPQNADALVAALEPLTEGIELVVPVGIGHSDHVAVREAALTLAGRGASVAFYADFPYAVEFGWPPSVTGARRQGFVDAEAFWAESCASMFDAGYSPVGVALDADAQQRKVEAMRTYETQFAALEAARGGA